MLDKFRIFENYKRAKKYLSDNDINNGDKVLIEVKNLLKSNPNLIYNFLLYRLTSNIPMGDKDDTNYGESLNGLLNYIKSNKQKIKSLPKELIKYTDFEELIDDITTLNDNKYIEKFIKDLYPKFRDQIDTNDTEVIQTIRHFQSLSKKEKALIPPMKHYLSNGKDVNDYLSDIRIYTSKKDNNNNSIINDILKYDGTEIIHNKDNRIILRTFNKELIKKYGSPKWCIVYAQNTYYNRYCSPLKDITQYILLDYNLPESSEEFRYGVSVGKDNSYKSGGLQDNLNHPVDISHIINQFQLSDNILKYHTYTIEEIINYFSIDDRLRFSDYHFTEEEKNKLRVNDKLSKGLTDNITDEEYIEINNNILLLIKLTHTGLYDKIDDENLLSEGGAPIIIYCLDNMLKQYYDGKYINEFEIFMDRLKSLYKGEELTLLKYSLPKDDGKSKLTLKGYTNFFDNETLKGLPTYTKVFDEYICTLKAKGDDYVLTDEEISNNLSLEIKLIGSIEFYQTLRTISIGKRLRDYITDDEILNIKPSIRVKHNYLTDMDKSKYKLTPEDKLIYSQLYRNDIIQPFDYDELRVCKKFISETSVFRKLLYIGRLESIERYLGENQFGEIITEGQLKQFIGEKYKAIIDEDGMEINGFKDEFEIYKDVYGIDYDLASDLIYNPLDKEIDTYEECEYIQHNFSIEDISNIKGILDGLGIVYTDESINDDGWLYSKLKDKSLGGIIESYTDSFHYERNEAYSDELAIVHGELYGEVGNNNNFNIGMVELITIFNEDDFDLDIINNINTLSELIEELPKFDYISNKYEVENGKKFILSEYEVSFNQPRIPTYEEVKNKYGISESRKYIKNYYNFNYRNNL